MDAERTYRTALSAYPSAYRERRAEEILGVLMEAGSDRPSVRETASLLRHGLAMRLARPSRRGVWLPSSAAAAMTLATVLAALAVAGLVDLGYGAWLDRGVSPGFEAWVDPRWPAYVLWLLTFGLLVVRRGAAAAVSAWVAVALLVTVTVRGSSADLGSYGELSQTWAAFELVVPSGLLALLLLRPAVGRAARASVGGRTVVVASLAGLLPTLVSLREGISGAWPAVLVLAVFLTSFIGRGVFLRGTLLVALAFVYVPLSGLTDGSGSRLPDDPTALAITLAVLPLLGAAVSAVLIRFLDGNPFLEAKALAILGRLTDAVRGAPPVG